MRRTAALVVLVLVTLAGCGRMDVAAKRVVSATPSASPSTTPTPVPIPTFEMTSGVVESKLYKAGKVPAVRCALPRPNLTTKSGMLAYAKVLVTCMNKAWGPVVERSDAYLGEPEVFAYSQKHLADTPECSDPVPGAVAFYHTSGMTGKICFDWEEALGDDPVFTRVSFEFMIAHEYGHHVQQSVGIITLFDELMRGKGKAGQLEVVRRMELQASCLGAAYLGANKQAFGLTGGERLETWKFIVKHMGDEYNKAKIRDHGSRKNHGYWTTRAFASTTPASCNTYTAPAKRVS